MQGQSDAPYCVIRKRRKSINRVIHFLALCHELIIEFNSSLKYEDIISILIVTKNRYGSTLKQQISAR